MGCALLAGQTGGAQQPKAPVLALMDPADAPQWRDWLKALGWRVVAPGEATAGENIDARVQALAAAVRGALEDPGVDGSRVYLAGRGLASAAVFYAVSRVPDLWAAAVMVGGSPQAAIDTGRIFAVNYSHVPLLWAGAGPDDAALAAKIKAEGVDIEFRGSGNLTGADLVQWLTPRTRDEFPDAVDCETTALAFGRCYWTEVVKFDPLERNDLLSGTQLAPQSGAYLDLGEFRYAADDPGPGITVISLPDKYSGPLKAGDRIMALDGNSVANARQFEQTMAAITEERQAAVIVQRGNDRRRIETSIALPKREPVITARVQAKYLPGDQEIDIISREVAAMRVTIPPQWVPVAVNWNGLRLDEVTSPGCIALWMEKELLRSGKCQ